MSLSNACERLITKTDILNHEFGVKSVVGKQQVIELEAEHYRLYTQLRGKLDTLIYLKGLKNPHELPAIEHERQTQDFFEKHTVVKNQVLDTIVAIIPILKSIHFQNDFNTRHEQHLYETLEKLYSLTTGKVFKVMELSKGVRLSSVYEELRTVLATLKEKMRELHEIESEEPKKLASRPELSKMCELITLLIANLPINWYSNEDVFAIFESTQEIASSLSAI